LEKQESKGELNWDAVSTTVVRFISDLPCRFVQGHDTLSESFKRLYGTLKEIVDSVILGHEVRDASHLKIEINGLLGGLSRY